MRSGRCRRGSRPRLGSWWLRPRSSVRSVSLRCWQSQLTQFLLQGLPALMAALMAAVSSVTPSPVFVSPFEGKLDRPSRMGNTHPLRRSLSHCERLDSWPIRQTGRTPDLSRVSTSETPSLEDNSHEEYPPTSTPSRSTPRSQQRARPKRNAWPPVISAARQTGAESREEQEA